MKFSNAILPYSIFIFVVSINFSHARVSSMSPVNNIEIDGENFSSVTINCETKRSRPILLRRQGQTQWCDSIIKSACYKEKMNAAQYVCSAPYIRATKALNKRKTGTLEVVKKKTYDVKKLLAEQRSIEDQLIEIQAKRLNLRRKELVLKSTLSDAELQTVR